MNSQHQISASAEPAREGGEGETLLPVLGEWVAAAGHRLQDSARLVMAETQLALVSFLAMVLLSVLAAGALLFTWAFLMVAFVQLLHLNGLALAAALGILGLAHLVLAWLLWRSANKLARFLKFAETRRLLRS